MAPPRVIKAELQVERIYLRKLEFQPFDVPELFNLKWRPNVKVDIEVKYSKMEDVRFEVVLHLHLMAKIGSREACEITAEQAGIFGVQDGPAQEHILTVACPNILFPYLREAIDNVAIKASLPPFAMAPVDFESMVKRAMEESAVKRPQFSSEVLN